MNLDNIVDIDSLKDLFAYRPSFPLQAIIKLANKEPISKKLLLKIWDYTLSTTGLLREASFNVLNHIVSKELYDDMS